ncbi:MAG: maleylpyruvate isomerase family mycothiol-dependent enzyme [Chloroflexi bacterium]|nr:maleylpyruvate isomerase family mycothiol-dependent enzyme [Chloroflexota bacterium]
MKPARFLACLAADEARLRAVAQLAPARAVPTCPGWTVADLTRHVGTVYLHKTVAMREGAEPDPWPPAGLADEEPLALLDRAYAGLLDEFTRRAPSDPAATWYQPDQTVRFWIRRMAQETVIHRIDAELGANQPVAPVPADLAVDGVDELLQVFLAYSVAAWGSAFTEILAGSPGWSYAVETDGAGWRVRTGPGVVLVEAGRGAGATDVTIVGPPAALLRWVWNREQPGTPSQVLLQGPAEAIAELQRCIVTAAQ